MTTLIVLDDRLGSLLLGFTPFYPTYPIGDRTGKSQIAQLASMQAL
jgi:hypothetical protein